MEDVSDKPTASVLSKGKDTGSFCQTCGCTCKMAPIENSQYYEEFSLHFHDIKTIQNSTKPSTSLEMFTPSTSSICSISSFKFVCTDCSDLKFESEHDLFQHVTESHIIDSSIDDLKLKVEVCLCFEVFTSFFSDGDPPTSKLDISLNVTQEGVNMSSNRVHDVKGNDRTPHDMIQCVDCQIQFDTLFELSSHVRKNHQDDPTIDLDDETGQGLSEGESVSKPGTTCGTSKSRSLKTSSSRNKSKRKSFIKSSVKHVPDLYDSNCTTEQGEEFQHECRLCFDSFTTVEKLNSHHSLKHSDTEKSNKCSLCHSTFKTMQCLLLHVKTVHKGRRDFKCPTCDAEFTQRGHLNYHVKSVHHKIKDTFCPHCGAAFSGRGDWNKHIMQVHSTVRKFSCGRCDFTSFSRGTLNHHVRAVHEKIKAHPCEVCGKAFASGYAMRHHVKTVHQNRRDFVCLVCGKTFSSSQVLKYHNRKVHDHIHDYRCGHCPLKFDDKTKLSEHLDYEHDSLPNFTCEYCPMTSLFSASINKHRKTVHGVGVKKDGND